MFHIVRRDEQQRGALARVQFEGAPYGSDVSFFLGYLPPGKGPGLHRHPYCETCIVRPGQAAMTVDGEDVLAGAGDIVVIGREMPHRFRRRASRDGLHSRVRPVGHRMARRLTRRAHSATPSCVGRWLSSVSPRDARRAPSPPLFPDIAGGRSAARECSRLAAAVAVATSAANPARTGSAIWRLDWLTAAR